MPESTSTKGLSKVESGPSEQPQYSSHNYPPSNNPPHPHVPAYGLPLPAANYPPPAPAPSTDHAYRPPGLSPYGLDPGVAPTTRLRSSIACRYCRKRKIRCSGKDSALGGKCQNCSRMNQECIFSDARPSDLVPGPFVHRYPPREGTYGPLGETPAQTRNQNHDIGSSGYGVYSSLSQYYYGLGLMSTIDDHDVLETRKSESCTSPERPVQALEDHQQQAQLPITNSPLPQGPKSRPLAASPEVLQNQDQESLNLGEASGTGLGTKLITRTEAIDESIELPNPAKLSIRSPTTSSSPTVSSNIDVDSISGDSEAPLDRNSLGYCLFSRIFSRLAILSQNEVTVKGESGNSSSKGKQVANHGFTSSSRTASMTSGRKNRRRGDVQGDERGDRPNEPPKKKGKTSQSHCDERSQFLACPYWKANSKKYWDCFLKKNDTIAHLKQHLTRRHTPKYYCQICYQTFRDFDLFDSHALERSCTRSPSAKLEGISQQQKNQLSLKSKGSVEQQWYTVWSILFPDMEPPATIYIYSTQSEDFCRIQEFAQREGVTIMLDELESHGLVVRPDASNQLLRSTVQRAMESIFRSYSVRRQPSSEAEEPIVIQDFQPDNEVSLQQESTTEGQIGHGNLPATSTDMNRRMEDDTDDSMIEVLNRPSMSTWSQLPPTISWLPRGVVQDNTEDELWGPAFPDEPAFGESSSGSDLPFNIESSDMLDLDALLRDVISSEA